MANVIYSARDNTIGPFFDQPATYTFDFTQVFEETVLSIGPSALLLLAIPFRVAWLLKRSRKVSGSPLRVNKVVGVVK